jgi:DNA-binding GntR family transcriptional regulator
MTIRKAARRPALADSLYDILRDQFIDGTRAAGEPLNITILSRELDVSQTPIREALARLEATGLVEREALRGYRVAPLLSEDDLVSMRDARLVLEPALIRAAATRVTPEFLATLLGTIETLDEASRSAADSATLSRYRSADERFHMTIARQSGNRFLASAYEALGGQVQRFRLFAEVGSSDAGEAAEEHRKIYEALQGQDADLATARMREHVANAGARALKDRRDVAEPRSQR